MKWEASAPANIALIKYMGKASAEANMPANASFSYTLEHLRTFVELELHSDLAQDMWEPLQNNQAHYVPALSLSAQQRYLKHLTYIKNQFNFAGNFIIRSANNFPAGCGIASSASSFAALTLCAVNALTELTKHISLNKLEIANLSRLGSGSSCRSLIGPWVLWQEGNIDKIELPYQQLIHHVIVISEHHKAVSSSEAHQRVLTSLLYEGRAARAHTRLEQLLVALKNQDWPTAYAITWQEFWDMHALFETSAKPFSYMQANSLEVLDYLRSYWENTNDGPIVTMDAGPNVHILFRSDQQEVASIIKRELTKKYLVL